MLVTNVAWDWVEPLHQATATDTWLPRCCRPQRSLTLIWYFMLQCRLLPMTRVATHEVDSEPDPTTRTLIIFVHFCAIWMRVLQFVFAFFFQAVFLLTGNKRRKLLQPVNFLGSSHKSIVWFWFSLHQWFNIVADKDFHYLNSRVFLCS